MNHEAGISAAVSACELPRNTVEKVVEAYQSARGDDEWKLKDEFTQKLLGRAAYCRDRGEVKTPELLERAAYMLTTHHQHRSAP